MLGTAIARMRAAMQKGGIAGEQEQYQRREQLTDRLAQESARREALGAQERARQDRIAQMAEDREMQEAFRRAQLEQQGALSREAEAGRMERAKSEETLRRDLANQAEALRRSLARPAGAGGSGGGAGAPVGPGLPPPDVTKETTLRKEFADHMRTHDQIAAGLTKVRTSAQLGTGQGDIGVLYGFMRMQDPTSTVRETEYATAANSAGVDEQVRQMYNKALDGQKLDPTVRAKFVAAAEALGADQSRSARQTAERYAKIGAQYGMPSERIVYDPYAAAFGTAKWGPNAGGVTARATSRPPLSAFPGAKP